MLKRLPKAVRTAIFGISSPIIVSAAFLPLPAWSQADAQQQADRVLELDIPAQSLTNALRALASQSGLQMVFPTELTAGREAPTIRGQQTPRQALDLMLQGSGLEYEFINERTVMVTRAPEGAAQQGATLERRSVAVEEVYVTARKRQETIQEIPLSISAFTAEDLNAAGIRGLADMEGIVPGLNMGGGGNGVKKDSNPFIRGVGQRETKVTLDPAVGTYIDGIYLARTAGAMLDTVGVERVEVLRGPQGTLFGKNTTGGAISVTTVKPQEKFGGSVSVNVGNYGRSDGSFTLNVPLIENKLLSRLTVSSKNNDGYFTNVVDNTKWGDDNRITGIGQLRWLPTDNVMFDLLGERTRIRETPRPQRCAVAREYDASGFSQKVADDYFELTGGEFPLPVNPNYFAPVHLLGQLGGDALEQQCKASESLPADKFASDFAEGNELMGQGRYWVDTSTLGLTGIWDIGQVGILDNVEIKSISAWRRVEQIADEDLDGVDGSYLLRVQPDFNETTQISQELQFTGSAFDDRLFFSTGVYYFKEETPQDDLIRTAGIRQYLEQSHPNSPTGEQYRTNALEPTLERLSTENESYSWFGQVDFDLTQQIQLTVGLRYTHEERWSEYSKAYAYRNSIVPGTDAPGLDGSPPSGVSDPLCSTSCGGIRSWEPGLAHILDWQFQPIGGSRTKSASTRDEAWTPMLSIKYNANSELLDRLNINDAMLYATYSEGFHSGGVTAGAIDYDAFDGPARTVENPVTFKPEMLKNYEIGLKLQAFDQRVQANMAIFYMDYKDMQVTSVGSRAGLPIPFVDNIGDSSIQGFEGEFVFLPTANWRIMANVAYTDADMKEWNAQNLHIPLGAFDGDYLEGLGGSSHIARDDEPMPRVPRWQGFLLTDYTFQLPNGDLLTPSIAARYTSEIYHGFDRGSFVYGKELVTSEATTFVDARISYLSADEKVEIALWAKNLTNKNDYLVGGIPLVDVTGATGQIFANPRTFGLEMTYRFGGGI